MKKLIVLALLIWGFPALPQMTKTLLNLDKNGVAIEGYDPVAFFTQGKPVKGNAQFQSSYKGATYYFASADDKGAFDGNPAKYEPQFGGFCAYGVSRKATWPRLTRTGPVWWTRRAANFEEKDQEMNAIEMNAKTETMGTTIFSWLLRILAAGILLQTLFFKFTAAPESVYIFTQVGAEPAGRIGSGVIELIAAVLLLLTRLTWLGSVLACGMMAGAIASHLTVLGIEVQGDKGLLFGLALTVFLASAVNLFLNRRQIPVIGRRLP